MNNINAARRKQEAATAQGEATRPCGSRRPKGSPSRCVLHGEGVAANARPSPWAPEVAGSPPDEQGIDPKEAMSLVALTQYMDTIGL